MILFVNACVRKESRTLRLAKALLTKLSGEVEEVKLEDVDFGVISQKFLNDRDADIAEGRFDGSEYELARQFARADTIVLAVPYWDLSFPAMFKQYVEHINVLGITFNYTPEGFPVGLCKAQKLYYVMTAGGSLVPEEYGYSYVKALAQNFYGIQDVRILKATGLDIYGADVEQIMNDAIAKIDSIVEG